MSSKDNKTESKIESFVIRSMVADSSHKKPYPSAASELAAYRATRLSPDEISALIQALNNNKVFAIPDIEPGTPLFWICDLKIVTMFYGGVRNIILDDDGEYELLCDMYTTRKGAIQRKTSDPDGQKILVPGAFGTCLFLDINEANCELQERVRLMMGD